MGEEDLGSFTGRSFGGRPWRRGSEPWWRRTGRCGRGGGRFGSCSAERKRGRRRCAYGHALGSSSRQLAGGSSAETGERQIEVRQGSGDFARGQEVFGARGAILHC